MLVGPSHRDLCHLPALPPVAVDAVLEIFLYLPAPTDEHRHLPLAGVPGEGLVLGDGDRRFRARTLLDESSQERERPLHRLPVLGRREHHLAVIVDQLSPLSPEEGDTGRGCGAELEPVDTLALGDCAPHVHQFLPRPRRVAAGVLVDQVLSVVQTSTVCVLPGREQRPLLYCCLADKRKEVVYVGDVLVERLEPVVQFGYPGVVHRRPVRWLCREPLFPPVEFEVR